MRRVCVAPYESWRYCELYKITQWKDDCVYKTAKIGCIKSGLEPTVHSLYPHKFVTSSFPTSLTNQSEGFWIDELSLEEIGQYVS